MKTAGIMRRRIVVEDETVLVQRAFAGDTDAFGRIVEIYQRPVFSLCVRFLGRQDAFDAAQETFLKAFLNQDSFDAKRALLPWLTTIAKRLCIDRLRQKGREQPIGSPHFDIPSFTHDAERDLSTKMKVESLSRELNELPENLREVVSMFHFDGLSYVEISEVLGVPVGTVMTWLYRGRQRLKHALGEPADEQSESFRKVRV